MHFRVVTSSLKHGLRGIGVVLVGVATLVAACGSAGQNAVRADAARRFSCAESRIDVDDLGPRTARASGCGQSLLYSCKGSQGSAQAPAPAASPLTEGEAHNPAQSGAPCSWVPND